MTEREIVTTKGERILVDADDYELISAHRWHVNSKGYAVRFEWVDGKHIPIVMHRQILGLRKGDPMVDHINGNRSDNRRANLRTCTLAENTMNGRRPRTNKSGYKGVHNQDGRWRAQIKYQGKKRSLGCFDTPEQAHEVYCLAADLLFGEFANYG